MKLTKVHVTSHAKNCMICAVYFWQDSELHRTKGPAILLYSNELLHGVRYYYHNARVRDVRTLINLGMISKSLGAEYILKGVYTLP